MYAPPYILKTAVAAPRSCTNPNEMAGGDEDFPTALRDCVIDKQIGRGANGRILEAKWEGIAVAVKEIHSTLPEMVGNLHEVP